MRKLLLALGLFALLVLPGWAMAAVTLYPPDQSTIAWDAVTTLSNGNPIPTGDTVGYKVYLSHDGLLPDGNPVEITAIQYYTLTFPAGEDVWFAGVSGVRTPQGTTLKIESSITWSNSTDAAAVPGGPFGWRTYLGPGSVKGLRRP